MYFSVILTKLQPSNFLSKIFWKTGQPILVKLIDLVNSVIIYLLQTTVLRWLTFLLGSQTVNLTVLVFWIYLFLLMVVFVLQWGSKACKTPRKFLTMKLVYHVQIFRKKLNFLRKKILRLSTEIPDGETTVSCMNLLETLNFLRKTILQYFFHDNCVMKVVLEWK